MSTNSHLSIFLKNKWVRFTLIIDIILIVTISVIAIYNTLKNSTISFNVAPVDAIISVNGDPSYTSGTYKVFPGEYTVTISHPDLDSKTFTITLDPHSSAEITTFLKDSKGFDFYKLKENYGSFEKLTSIASTENNQTTDHDTSAKDFISEYSKNIELYNSLLPYQEIERDEKNAVATMVTLTPVSAKDSPCSKYLCINATSIGVEDPNYINNLLQKNGFDLKYLELSSN